MVRDVDDDALAWDGDDDPTLDAPKKAPAAASALPSGYAAVGKGSTEFSASTTADPEPAIDTEPSSAMSNAALLSLGVFGGIYLLYTIGWVIGGLRLQIDALAAISAPFFYGSLLLAVIAPVVWFATTYLLTRSAKSWVRIVWLLAGAVLLVPWPFLMVGPVAS